jgi:hypothetical protein
MKRFLALVLAVALVGITGGLAEARPHGHRAARHKGHSRVRHGHRKARGTRRRVRHGHRKGRGTRYRSRYSNAGRMYGKSGARYRTRKRSAQGTNPGVERIRPDQLDPRNDGPGYGSRLSPNIGRISRGGYNPARFLGQTHLPSVPPLHTVPGLPPH